MVLVTVMSMIFAFLLFLTKVAQSHMLPLGTPDTSICYVQIVTLESGEMRLKEWLKFQLHTGMDGY